MFPSMPSYEHVPTTESIQYTMILSNFTLAGGRLTLILCELQAAGV